MAIKIILESGQHFVRENKSKLAQKQNSIQAEVMCGGQW